MAAKKINKKKARVKWSLYILKCGDGTLYTGITTDLDRRTEQHNNGTASRYTRSRLPVKVIHQEPCRGKSNALKKEYAMKQLSRAEKEAYIDMKRKAFRSARRGKPDKKKLYSLNDATVAKG